MIDQKEFDKLKDIKKRNREKLFSLPNVNGVGIGFKEVNGKVTDQVAIRVYVTKKVAGAQLKENELIPVELEGVTSDVIETGEMSLASHLTRVRPIRGGDAIGRCDQDYGGTLGGACFYDNVNDDRVLLTCAHVLTYCVPGVTPGEGEAGDYIAQPWTAFGSGCPQDAIGSLKRFIEYVRPPAWNQVDAGIATAPLDPSLVSDEIHDLGTPAGCRSLTANDVLDAIVQKSGAVSGLTSGLVADISYDFTVQHCEISVQFEDQILVFGMASEGGDSGALILDSNNIIVGMMIASGGDYTAASPIAPILSKLNIRFELTPASRWNKVDAAIAGVINNNEVSPEIHDIGTPLTYRRLTAADEGATVVQKSGRTSGYTQGLVSDVFVDLRLGKGTTSELWYEDQIAIQSRDEVFAYGGDSGAAILDMQNRLVGLLWGGNDDWAWACHIDDVLTALDISVIATSTSTSTSTSTTTTSTSTTTTITSTSTSTITSTSTSTSTSTITSTSTTTTSTSTTSTSTTTTLMANWKIETVETGLSWCSSPSLALNVGGNPHISYYDYSNADLKYAYWDGATWQIETVDSDGAVGTDSSLALDTNGYPHIAYYDATNKNLKYAYWDGIAWQIETVDSVDTVGSACSLALDTDNYPHISYRDTTNARIKYAYKDIGGWNFEVVDTGPLSTTSLALTEDGYPHVSYRDLTAGDLKYAYKDALGWHPEIVDQIGTVGHGLSLAMDASGYPCISYFDWTNSDLKFAYWDGAMWHFKTLDETGDVGLATSLAFDADGSFHISYFDHGNRDLKYAYGNVDSWSIETVDSGGWVGENTSLALDANSHPHIAYTDWTNFGIKYAYKVTLLARTYYFLA